MCNQVSIVVKPAAHMVNAAEIVNARVKFILFLTSVRVAGVERSACVSGRQQANRRMALSPFAGRAAAMCHEAFLDVQA
jgi:hypothetical protein